MNIQRILSAIVIATASMGTAAQAGSRVLDGVLEIHRSNLALSRTEAAALDRKHMPTCRNVLLKGPVGASFAEAHFLAQAAAKIGNDPAFDAELYSAVDDGFSCRPARPYGFSCTGMTFLDATEGEVIRPEVAGYQKYGERFGDYVAVNVRMLFASGRSEIVQVVTERKNTKCIGGPEDPGMLSGGIW